MGEINSLLLVFINDETSFTLGENLVQAYANIPNKVKRINSFTYASYVSQRLFYSTKSFESYISDPTNNQNPVFAHEPPHLLIRSLEDNLVNFQTWYTQEPLTNKLYSDIINYYHTNIPDYYTNQLDKGNEEGLLRFFIAFAYEQFLWQIPFDINTFGRIIYLYLNNTSMKTTSAKFLAKYSISIEDWLILILCLYSYTFNNIDHLFFTEDIFLNSNIRSLPLNKLDTFLHYSSITPENYRDEYTKVHNEFIFNKGEEFFFTPLLYQNPILKFSNTFICTNYKLLAFQAKEKLYSLCTEADNNFPGSLGKPFEDYTYQLFNELNHIQILNEKSIKRLYRIESEVCDILVEFPESVLLIECKATKCTAIKKTPETLRTNNSMNKIGKGISQLITASQIIKTFYSKPLLGLLVTYGEFYFPNHDWYFENIIRPNIHANNFQFFGGFEKRPTILSISTLERFIQISLSNQVPITDLIKEKFLSENNHIPMTKYNVSKSLQTVDNVALNFFNQNLPEINFKRIIEQNG